MKTRVTERTMDELQGSGRSSLVEDGDEPLIGGRFRLGNLLGVGGTASVFSAEDTLHDDVLVAVKLLQERLVADAREVDAFLAPARAVEQLAHDNIAGIVAVSDDNDPAPWIAMDLATGFSAAERIDISGPLGVRDALAVASGLLRALEAVHNAGLVHRDVTPANVIVAGEPPLAPGDVRLIDFGLAAASGLTAIRSTTTDHSGDVAGSVHYISPEQAQGRSVDARGDLYQVGAVLFFLLTGRAPYPRDTTRQVLEAHVGAQPPVPSAWADGVPIAVDRIVTKAMAKTLRYRFASATEMLAAVTAASELVAAAPEPAAEAATVVFSATSATLLSASLASAPTERFGTVPGRVPGYAPDYLVSREGGAHPFARRHRPLLWAFVAVVPLVIVTGLAAAAGSSAPEPKRTTSAPVAEPPVAAPVDAVPSEWTRVPALGTSRAEAEAALARAGLTMNLVRETSASGADTVLRSEPAVAASIKRGGAVTVIVASGENSVPVVTALTAEAAEAALRAAGFEVTIVSQAYDAAAEGTSLGTNPTAGTALALGTTISLLVAKGAPVAEPTPSPTPTPSVPVDPPTEPVTTVP